jgi:hypothetical protein
VIEECREVQLVLLFGQRHYVTQACKKKKEKRKEKKRGGAFSSLINAHIIVLRDNIVDGEKFDHFL